MSSHALNCVWNGLVERLEGKREGEQAGFGVFVKKRDRESEIKLSYSFVLSLFLFPLIFFSHHRGSVVPSTRGGAGMLAVSAAYAFHQLQKKNISWPFSSLFVEGL